jgi:hypothetical protein
MRACGKWAAPMLATLTVAVLALGACDSAPSAASPTATRVATPSPSASGQRKAGASVAWTAFAADGAIQVWIDAPDGSPRLLANLTQAAATCQMVAAGLAMPSPDGAHVLVSEGEECGGLIDDPGPLLVVDTASGRSSVVPLPGGATVLPQVRSYGWADDHTVFAFFQDTYTAVVTFLYTLGAGQAEMLTGLQSPLEGVVRGSTLFYLQTTSGEGGIQSILRRYDLARRAPIGGGIDLGAYASCSECPGLITSPGWDVSADGGHVVFQRTTPRATGGIATSQVIYEAADGGDEVHIAQYLATSSMAHLRLSPDGTRVAITAAYPSPAVITACVDSPGTRADPCFATYSPDAASYAAWSADGRSFLAATVDASYGQPTSQAGGLVRYTLGTAAGQSVAVAYGPWSAP